MQKSKWFSELLDNLYFQNSKIRPFLAQKNIWSKMKEIVFKIVKQISISNDTDVLTKAMRTLELVQPFFTSFQF